MKLPQLTVIGGGLMARALVGGMIDQSILDANNLTVVATSQATGQWWQESYPGCRFFTADSPDSHSTAIAQSEIVMLAVKPHILPTVLSGLGTGLAGKLVISVAAGVPLAKLTAGVGHERVARVMPNTPSLVGEGAAAYCTAADASESDVESIEAMLGSVGYVTEVTESQLDAVTGVSGSGPAYVFLMIEALADGGVAAGLPRKIALELATQTVRGAATMVRDTGEHPGALKDKVCSPGGTTIAAVRVLEQNAIRAALIDAVAASAGRSRELAQ